MIDFQDLQGLLVIGSSLGLSMGIAFLFVRFVQWLFSFVAGRVDKKNERIDGATQYLIGQLQGQVETLVTRCNQIEEHHAHCLEELASLRGYVDGRGDARQHAQLIVSAERNKDKKGERK